MVNRKDFRPSSAFGYSMSKKDRQLIKENHEASGESRSKGRKGTSGVVTAFINGESKGTSKDNVHTDGKHLYSYKTVIATKQKDGTVVVNNTVYGATTSGQQRELERQLKENHVKYDVTGGKDFGYEGEDFSKSKTDNIEYLDFVESEDVNKRYVAVSKGLYDTHYEKFSDVVNEDGSSKHPIERNAKGFPVLYDHKGDGYVHHYVNYNKPIYAGEIKDEKKGAEHYEKLAKENPEHADTLNRMASNEREHEKKLKEIQTMEKKENKYQNIGNPYPDVSFKELSLDEKRKILSEQSYGRNYDSLNSLQRDDVNNFLYKEHGMSVKEAEREHKKYIKSNQYDREKRYNKEIEKVRQSDTRKRNKYPEDVPPTLKPVKSGKKRDL